MILYNPNDAQTLVTDNHWLPTVHVDATDRHGDQGVHRRRRRRRRTATFTAGRGRPAQGSVDGRLLVARPEPGAPRRHQARRHRARRAHPRRQHADARDRRRPAGQLLPGRSPARRCRARTSPGSFALLRQAHPDWTRGDGKSALMTTARQDVVKEDAGTPADPFDMGAGHVDPSGQPSAPVDVHRRVSSTTPTCSTTSAFLCDADPSVFVEPGRARAGTSRTPGVPTSAGRPQPAVDRCAARSSARRPMHRTVTSVADHDPLVRRRRSRPRTASTSPSSRAACGGPGRPSRARDRRRRAAAGRRRRTVRGCRPSGTRSDAGPTATTIRLPSVMTWR